MRFAYLFKGLPGHPIHPPLTDVTIGAYAFATIAAVLSKAGVAEHGTASAWWLALVVALLSTALTAATGFVDWIDLEWGSATWRTATLHMTAMLSASVVFLVAALVGHHAYVGHEVSTIGLVLTLAGFALLTLGGWLGGAVVYVHGMRVLVAHEDAPALLDPARLPDEQ
jgi:uncharacterized membrane protein